MDGDWGRAMRRIGRSNRKEGKEQWRKFRGENFITCTLLYTLLHRTEEGIWNERCR